MSKCVTVLRLAHLSFDMFVSTKEDIETPLSKMHLKNEDILDLMLTLCVNGGVNASY